MVKKIGKTTINQNKNQKKKKKEKNLKSFFLKVLQSRSILILSIPLPSQNVKKYHLLLSSFNPIKNFKNSTRHPII